MSLVAAAVALVTVGIVIGLSSSGGGSKRTEYAQAAASRTCIRIGSLRWCFRSTPEEIAGVLDPAARLTGGGPATTGTVGPPAEVTRITFNVPAVPGGVVQCENAGDSFDCH